MHIEWQSSKDGAGSGLAQYRYEFTVEPFALSVLGRTAASVADSSPLTDGSNVWVSVRACDIRGNVSAPAVSGPYWIDAAAPSALDATIGLSLSPFGNYVVGTNAVTGLWSRFTDAGSGIEGYYYALANHAGTSNGEWTTLTSGTLTGAEAGATNTLFVWARDRLGHIGMAASASFAVLNADDDTDGDQLSNAQEETAGTDASNPLSALRLATAFTNAEDLKGVVLRWNATTNRHYTLFYRDSLAPDASWVPLPDFIGRPGQNGAMVHTDSPTNVPVRYYRVFVDTP
jgi:hypothetical protein